MFPGESRKQCFFVFHFTWSYLIDYEGPWTMRFSFKITLECGKLQTCSDVRKTTFFVLFLLVFPCRCLYNQSPRHPQDETLTKINICLSFTIDLLNWGLVSVSVLPRKHLHSKVWRYFWLSQKGLGIATVT